MMIHVTRNRVCTLSTCDCGNFISEETTAATEWDLLQMFALFLVDPSTVVYATLSQYHYSCGILKGSAINTQQTYPSWDERDK